MCFFWRKKKKQAEKVEEVKQEPVVEETKEEVKEKPAKEEKTKKVAAIKKVEAKKTTKKTESEKSETKKVAKKVEKEESKAEVKEDSEEVEVKAKKAVYRVIYDKEKHTWQIRKDGAKRVIDSKPTKEAALARVKELSENNEARVVVHKKDGKFQKK